MVRFYDTEELAKFYHSRLWPANQIEGKCFATHKEAVISISCGSNGKWLASASEDRYVSLWDLESGVELLTFQLENITKDQISKTSRLIHELHFGSCFAQPSHKHASLLEVRFTQDSKGLIIWDGMKGELFEWSIELCF